eukprot:scaffold274043_cov24-Tisochrysis_lutea.AAC.1
MCTVAAQPPQPPGPPPFLEPRAGKAVQAAAKLPMAPSSQPQQQPGGGPPAVRPLPGPVEAARAKEDPTQVSCAILGLFEFVVRRLRALRRGGGARLPGDQK